MRVKKDYIVITFSTTNDAMAFESRCMEQHIPGRTIPVPSSVRAGCGIAWRMTPEEYEEHKGSIEHFKYEDVNTAALF